MKKLYTKKFARLISFLAVITFFNSTIAYSAENLSIQLPSNPIEDDSVREEVFLGTLLANSVRRDPSIVYSKLNMSSGEYIVCFSESEEIELREESGSKKPGRLFVVPCFADHLKYYVYLVRYEDGSEKIAVNSKEKHEGWCEDIRSKGMFPVEVTDRLKELSSAVSDDVDSIRFMDITDESVRSVVSFLGKIGAPLLSSRLKQMAEEKKVLLSEVPILVAGGIAVKTSKSAEDRSRFILETMLIDRGVPMPVRHSFEKAFEEFTGDEDAFALEKNFSQLVPFIRDIEVDLSGISNEGSLRFDDRAFNGMIDVSDIELVDCAKTIADIKRIIQEVAKYEMERHNRAVEKDQRISGDDMPGLYAKDILVEHLSDGFLPTAIMRKGEDGRVKIVFNENFVKIMHKWGNAGIHGSKGRIADYPKTRPPKILGDLYESILYSVALHKIRGHFKINEFGFAVFNPSEIIAQGERGEGHVYVNILASLFHWVYMVERAPHPRDRAWEFIKQNPQLFKKLTPEQIARLPVHLLQLCHDLNNRGVKLWTFSRMIDADLRRDEIERMMREAGESMKGGETSNEGVIDFLETAYSEMPDTGDLELPECELTVEAIREIFMEVAISEMERYNRSVPWDERMDERDLPVKRILFEPLSSCLLPTVIVLSNGSIGINENFVKVMEVLRRKGLDDTSRARLDHLEGINSPHIESSTLWRSIIYSIALHEVRGHFPIGKLGIPAFEPDEKKAQPKRGNDYLYTNLLAVTYYWLCVAEHSGSPVNRLGVLMRENPELFKGLTRQQKRAFKSDFAKLKEIMEEEELTFYPDEYVSTGTTKDDVLGVLPQRADVAWNEGKPGEETENREVSPSEVLQTLYSNKGPMAIWQIAEALSTNNLSSIGFGIILLADMNIVELKDGPKGEQIFEVLPLKSHQVRRIGEILEENEVFSLDGDIRKARGEIYEITERRWAHALINSLLESEYVQDLKSKGQKIILALETDWIPEEQQTFIRTLVQELDKLEGKGPIEVVRASKSDLAVKLETKIGEEKKRGIAHEDVLKNVVVLAGEDTIRTDRFLQTIKGEAFMAGVDASQLIGDSYVRILEMITMAVRSATGQELISRHYGIEVKYPDEYDPRTVIFIPRAEKVDPESHTKIYDKQRKLLSAA